MSVSFQTESYADVIDTIKSLLEAHWEEIAPNRDIPLNPDYEAYQAIERMGLLTIVTARDDGDLIGYAIYFKRQHIHYRNHLWAASDIFWLHPDHRRGRVGLRLFQYAEQVLRDQGVHVMHNTTKVAHPAASRMFEALGHTLVEMGYSKRLG